MSIAALITWLITALGGFYLLGTWLARGGVRQQQTKTTRFPAPVIFGHFLLLAAAGLVVWIIYVAADTNSPPPRRRPCSGARPAMTGCPTFR